MSDAERKKRLVETAKRVTSSPESAEKFLISAGILTKKGNLAPQYR